MSFPQIRELLIRRIYNTNDGDFVRVALDIFQYQFKFNPIYRQFCDVIHTDPDLVQSLAQIPFLPISFFREHSIKTGGWDAAQIFTSSGTTGMQPSKHLVPDLNWYHRIATQCFTAFFGSPAQYTWIGLLPSYLERPDSSLINMVNAFMEMGSSIEHEFFPVIDDRLIVKLDRLAKAKIPVILIGVSFALLDLFEHYHIPVWDNLTVIETGGMKGRRAEITRPELHQRIQQDHHGLRIASEYGMTELLSQAYDRGDGFAGGPTMRVLIRDISDPFRIIEHGQRGVINVIDLANVDTCAFIATDDVGISYAENKFDVLGRLDQSEMRGCNLMYT